MSQSKGDFVISCGVCGANFVVTTVRHPDVPETTTMPETERCPDCGSVHEPQPTWDQPAVKRSLIPNQVGRPRVVSVPAAARGGRP